VNGGRSVKDQLPGLARLIGGAFLGGQLEELATKAVAGEGAPKVNGDCIACDGCGEVVDVDPQTKRPRVVQCPNGCPVREAKAAR
jgi:hypothetical protein